ASVSGLAGGPEARVALRALRAFLLAGRGFLVILAVAGRALSGVLGVEELQLRDRLAQLWLGVGLNQVDERLGRVDPDLGLAEIALVLLGDPARRQGEDADHAVQDHGLDTDPADLVFELGAELLLRRLFGTASR